MVFARRFQVLAAGANVFRRVETQCQGAKKPGCQANLKDFGKQLASWCCFVENSVSEVAATPPSPNVPVFCVKARCAEAAQPPFGQSFLHYKASWYLRALALKVFRLNLPVFFSKRA
jgi:hypothetical protein